jgi:4-hydroxybenzoate polyprenyltransferase
MAALLVQAPVSPTLWILLAGSLLYLAGCTLNDAWDAAWDGKFRPERPIPAGRLSRRQVWILGFSQATLALGILAFFGLPSLAGGLVTFGVILLYDWLHKKTAWSVVLMASCRVFWVLTAVLALGGVPMLWRAPTLLWLYLGAVSAEILLISQIARGEAQPRENRPQSLRWLPLVYLGLISIAFTLGAGPAWEGWPFFLCWLLILLAAWGNLLKAGRAGIGNFVAAALAGICMLDAAFLALVSLHAWAPLAVGAYLLAKVLQRSIPAT